MHNVKMQIGKKKNKPQMGNPEQHAQSDHFNDMLAGDLPLGDKHNWKM